MKLTKEWHVKLDEFIAAMAFANDGRLGVAQFAPTGVILAPNGGIIAKVKAEKEMGDVSYCCGRFGFVSHDGHAYITDRNGNLIKEVYVGDAYDVAITMTEDGFVACKYRCALFDFNGNKLWDLDVGWVVNGPSHYKGYWYVADWNELLIVKDGSVDKEIGYGKYAWDTAVCGKYLAVSTYRNLYLYDLSDPANPRELWRVGGLEGAYQVAFGPDCKYIAVADTYNCKLKIYDFNGNLVLEKEYNQYGDWHDNVWSVAWWRDRIAVGLEGGDVILFKVFF